MGDVLFCVCQKAQGLLEVSELQDFLVIRP